MKYLALALLLCALASLSNAHCSVKGLKAGQTHCHDDVDLTWHAVGSSWRNSDCMECTCERCCAAYTTPRNIPADCVSVFNAEQCVYIVHKRDNPKELCPIYDAVGK